MTQMDMQAWLDSVEKFYAQGARRDTGYVVDGVNYEAVPCVCGAKFCRGWQLIATIGEKSSARLDHPLARKTKPIRSYRKRPTVVDLPISNVRDVPAMLRNFAEQIEKGEYGEVKTLAAVLFRSDYSMSAFAWGDCNPLEIVGAFQRGTLLDEGGFVVNGAVK